MEGELGVWGADFDWTRSPWFLEGENDIFDQMGFPLALRKRAAASLAQLFTPDVCREISRNPRKGFGSAVFLFQRWWPGVLVPLLKVGLDLEVVNPGLDDVLLKRLTRRNEFANASQELHVLASLLRSGYTATRIPEDPGKRTPDLVVRIGLDDYEVEVKAIGGSELLQASDTVHEALTRGDLMVPGLHLELVGSLHLHKRALSDLPGLLKDVPQIVSAFEGCVRRIREGGGKPGRYEAEPYGAALAKSMPGLGSMTPFVLPDLSPEKRVNKVVRLVRDAARQLTRRRGLVVIGLHRFTDIVAVSQAIQRAALENPSAFGTCHMVILADSMRDPAAEYRSIPLAHVVQDHERRQITKGQVRFAAAAAGERGHFARLIQPARPGQPGFTFNIIKRGITSAKIGPDGKLDMNTRLPSGQDQT